MSSDKEPEKGVDDEDPKDTLYPPGMPKDIQKKYKSRFWSSNQFQLIPRR
jgi:hypothetical protein